MQTISRRDVVVSGPLSASDRGAAPGAQRGSGTMGQIIFTVLTVLAVLVWLLELVWLFKVTEEERGDPFRVVSGAAIFFVAAAPIARLAPGVVDSIGGAIESAVNAIFGRRGHNSQQPLPDTGEAPARLLIDGEDVPLGTPRVRLGRYPNNDVVIDNTTVSAYHAEIIRRPDGRHEIVDRESRNGTRVNGAIIRSQVLHDGDLITLGGATLHYLGPAQLDTLHDIPYMSPSTSDPQRQSFEDY